MYILETRQGALNSNILMAKSFLQLEAKTNTKLYSRDNWLPSESMTICGSDLASELPDSGEKQPFSQCFKGVSFNLNFAQFSVCIIILTRVYHWY